MRKIDQIRTDLGLAQIGALHITGRAQHYLPPLDGGQDPWRKPIVRSHPAADDELLAGFRAIESESKQRRPKRPLPCRGDVRARRLTLRRERSRRLLPIFFTGERDDGSYFLLQVEPGADVQVLILTAASEDPIYLDVEVQEGARLQLDIVKVPGYPSWQLLSWRARVARDAQLIQHSVNLDSSAYQVGQVWLDGPGAEAHTHASALVQTFEEQRIDVSIAHEQAHTRSGIHNFGVVQGSGHGFFATRGRIAEGASGTTCRQEGRFLTLSPLAEAHSYPVLLIDDYDVQAGHAATVGGLDDETLYYLQSRGLPREEAERLVTTGFLSPAIHGIGAQCPEARGLAAHLLDCLAERI